MLAMKQSIRVLALLVLLCVLSPAQATTDSRLMSDAEYKAFLIQVEARLAEWERALQSVDPAKTNMSYAVGERIVQYKNIGLIEVKNARDYVHQERVHRRVSKELALHGFLQGIFDSMHNILILEPRSYAPLESYAREMGELIAKVANDTTARVELLEKGTCP